MKKKLSLKDRLVLGLDVSADKVGELLTTVGSLVGWAKINRAFIAGGIPLLKAIQRLAHGHSWI
jgi:hypothetical protein